MLYWFVYEGHSYWRSISLWGGSGVQCETLPSVTHRCLLESLTSEKNMQDKRLNTLGLPAG